MKILVVGSEGFIGNSIVNYYVAKKNQVAGIDMKTGPGTNNYNYFHVLSINYSLENIIKDFVPDICIFAGGSASVSLSLEQPHPDFESNVAGVSSILESLVKINKRCKFVHISSAAVYGNPKKLPVQESDSCEPLSPYGWHKYQAELLCTEYFSCYKLPTSSVRPFSVFGEGQNKLLFWDLHKKFTLQQKKVELFGGGKESRDFIYIGDFLKALDLVIKKGKFNGESYNIGSGTETTIKEAAEIFRRIVGSKKEIIFNGKARKGDPNRWKADVDKIKKLGFEPAVGLEAGLKKYYKWLKENG